MELRNEPDTTSPGVFAQARTKSRDYADQMAFHDCDILKDPTSQSFKAGNYELVTTVGLGVSEFVYRIIALFVSVVSGIDWEHGFNIWI